MNAPAPLLDMFVPAKRAVTVTITIAVDNDVAGQRAARLAASRWRKEGRKVRLAIPDKPDQDFNDILLERAHA